MSLFYTYISDVGFRRKRRRGSIKQKRKKGKELKEKRERKKEEKKSRKKRTKKFCVCMWE